jgi:hypothetical protein
MRNGRAWPVTDGETVWLPAGSHVLEPANAAQPVRLARFNGELTSAVASGKWIEFSYRSSARALAVVEGTPVVVEIDGVTVRPVWFGERILVLPRGQHLVRMLAAAE